MSEQKRSSVFSNRDFKLLFFGSSVSMIGDQFTLVALPWLVLKLTGDPAALGIVLAVMALPRAAFMLIGGAVVDRMSARRVLLASRALNAAFVTLLAVLVMGGGINMGMLYFIALGIGFSTAFVYPAGSAILPQLMEPEQLQAANGLIMAMRQLSMFVGPIMAGFVIFLGAHAAVASQPRALADATGMGLAFSIDAISFLFSLASLYVIRIHTDYHPPKPEGGVLADVLAGLRSIWADLPLRAFILYVSMIALFVGGPVQVGLPVLANTRLDLGAAALGTLMTANGGGVLVGSVLSRVSTRLFGGRLGIMFLSLDVVAGLAFVALVFVHSTLSGAALLMLLGAFMGINQVGLFSWVQQRVPQAMMGRTMSVMFFTFMGLGPISAAAAGFLLKFLSLSTLFAGAGLAMSLIALACLANPALRSIAIQLPASAKA